LRCPLGTEMSLLFPGVPQGPKTEDFQLPTKEAPWTWSPYEEESEDLTNECPDCQTDKWLAVEEDEVICKKCGITLGFNIDSSAEYRWFGSEDRNPDPTRVGNPLNPLLPESSLGTRIMARPGENRAMLKIRQYHLWNVMPYRERTLWNVFEMLQVRAANAGISSVIVEETKQLYAQVSPLCICRGQQKDALMAACLFESLKRHDTPRRPQEVADIFKIDLKLITRGVKQFASLLDEHMYSQVRKELAEVAATNAATCTKQGIDVPVSAPVTVVAAVATPSTSFRHYLEPAILRLETPRTMMPTLVHYSGHYGNLLDELGVCPETTPPSLAACALSLACVKLGIPKSNSDIASVCGISMATLQKCLKRIEPWKPVLFKEEN
jgi:transcription initiation factor TFIIIB Brf1 subunit/transcription initiation factor TFIIB